MKVDEVVQKRYDLLGETVKTNLINRSFEAYYVKTKEEAKEKALELIGKDKVISWGGSQSIAEIGLQQHLREGGYKLIDRDTGKTKEEKEEIMRQGLFADVFLMSTNAISEQGELVNIDGRGNRLASLCYGPKEVIMIVGMNKVAKTLDDAIQRARTVAAPINMQRTFTGAPCEFSGVCQDCKTQKSICAQMLITRVCKPQGRIKVILVGENLGY